VIRKDEALMADPDIKLRMDGLSVKSTKREPARRALAQRAIASE
jgi:hypothetical protein